MFSGIIGKDTSGEPFKGERTREARNANWLETANTFKRFGKVPSDLSRRRDADGCGESASRLDHWLLIQGPVERR
jgi:hypothetical protein